MSEDDTPSPSKGTVYLIHFDRPLGRLGARHYVGWTSNLERRFEEHKRGTSGVFMGRVHAAGIGIQIVRTWEGGKDLELKIKKNSAKKKCPICIAEERSKGEKE